MNPDRSPNWKILTETSSKVAYKVLKVATALALLTLTFGPLPDAPYSRLIPLSEDDLEKLQWNVIGDCNRPDLPEIIQHHRPFYLCQKLLRTFENLSLNP